MPLDRPICACAVLYRDGEVLIAKRAAKNALYPGQWDFVGGHCQGEETPGEALVREVREETGVTPTQYRWIDVLPEPNPGRFGKRLYHIFLVTAWSGGEPAIADDEHDAMEWVSLRDTASRMLALDAYKAVLDRIERVTAAQ